MGTLPYRLPPPSTAAGEHWIQTPPWLARKKCIINVENSDDECFRWAVLSALHPPADHPERVTKYQDCADELNFDGLQFPITVKDISKFEKLNPDIAIHLLWADRYGTDFSILHLSQNYVADDRQVITLLLLQDQDRPDHHHYVWVKRLSALLSNQNSNHNKQHYCLSCLNGFTSEQALRYHRQLCLKHVPQQTDVPQPGSRYSTMKFDRHHLEFPMSFYIVADFESFLSPPTADDDDDAGANIVDTHRVSGFCTYRVTDYEQYRTAPYCYSGDDPIRHFFRHLETESREICQIMSRQTPMRALTTDENLSHERATECHVCKVPFDPITNHKCHHHDHITGNYLFAACNNCNLCLKPRRSNPFCSDSQFLVPVVMHNMGAYDSHFILREYRKEYLQHYDSRAGTMRPAQISLLPLNSEKSLQLQISNVRFVDSYQFLTSSLESLVASLAKSGHQNFIHTTRYLGQHDFLFQKGVFCYNYMTDRSKFDEPTLPPKDKFFNSLLNEPITDEDYSRAQTIWNHYGMTRLQQYHDFYLTTDVLLLADVFENFRKTMLADHGLECLHFPTLPSLTLQMGLKITRVELELLTDLSMYLMLESGIRGGMSYIAQRYARANHPSLPEYDADRPISHLIYLDCNSLYATCQINPLPLNNFRFLSPDEIETFELSHIEADADTGYILEVDLKYPQHLHDRHNEYPLAPHHVTITRDMLSPHARELDQKTGNKWHPGPKLCTTLLDKSNYVVHYRCLQFYIKHGLTLSKIHRILAFNQRPFMRPFIQYCNDRRKAATNDFESGLWKLFANAFFGKTCENVRNHENLRLISDAEKFRKEIIKPSVKRIEPINKDLVMVRHAPARIHLNKPIAVGFTILEISKLLMYQFYYDCLKPRYGDKIHLCLTDTDSLICEIETPDLHADMAENPEWYDTSNFDADHPLFSTANKRVLGKFKSETGSRTPVEFCGLRSKMYSLHAPTSVSFRKAKGVPKAHVKKHVTHEDYVDVLRKHTTTQCTFRHFRSLNHQVTTRETSKACLHCFDDKRYLLEDSIHSLAYGHYAISPPPESNDNTPINNVTPLPTTVDACWKTSMDLNDADDESEF